MEGFKQINEILLEKIAELERKKKFLERTFSDEKKDEEKENFQKKGGENKWQE